MDDCFPWEHKAGCCGTQTVTDAGQGVVEYFINAPSDNAGLWERFS